MSPARRMRVARVASLRRGALLVSISLAFGCTRSRDDVLTVATDLTPAECARLEHEFQSWVATGHDVRESPRFAWLHPAAGVEPANLVDRRVPVDVVVGGSPTGFTRLDRTRSWREISPGDSPRWRVYRRRAVGWAVERGASIGPAAFDHEPLSAGGAAAFFGRLALDDPRRDPTSFAFASAALDARGWSEGYADLLRTFGNARQIGGRRHAAVARLVRREAACALSDGTGVSGEGLVFHPTRAAVVEGVAICRNAPNERLGRAFVRFLEEAGHAARPDAKPLAEPGKDALLAELLGAALVDAHDELVAAKQALDRAGSPPAPRWLVPPPWPPASVQRLLDQDGTGELLEALAAQVAPALDIRIWLLESWKGPSRRVDGALLDDLARAVDGKLVAEPRFRAWLRAEWTAWSRQSDRRIVRQLQEGGSPTGGVSVRQASGHAAGLATATEGVAR